MEQLKDIEAAIEGILFAAGEPVGVERLCLTLELDRETVDTVCQRLADQYSYERRGIRVLKLDNCWQMASAPEYAEVIRKTFESRKPARLSQPALEVLSIIAYYQPATRAYIDQVRGVDSSYTVGLLLERELIEEAGRLAVPGRPILYRTTKTFLRSFGLSSLDELPELPTTSLEDGQITLEMQANIEKLRALQQLGSDVTDEELLDAARQLAAQETAPLSPEEFPPEEPGEAQAAGTPAEGEPAEAPADGDPDEDDINADDPDDEDDDLDEDELDEDDLDEDDIDEEDEEDGDTEDDE